MRKKTNRSLQCGLTLMELAAALGISTVLAVVIVAFCSNMVFQYKEQKEILERSSKTTYLLRAFDEVQKSPSVRVRTDNKALEVSNTGVSPATKAVYYQLDNSLYKDTYEDSVYKNTVLISEDFSADFSLQSDASYLKDILKIVITDSEGTSRERKVSLRDCDVVEVY